MNKLNRIEAICLLKEYLETNIGRLKWYQDIKPNIKAIVFYGSTAKGLNKAGSDLDILIFVPLEIELKYTKGEYSYKFKGREINIVLRSIERLRKLGKEKDCSFEADVFQDCEMLYEHDPEVRKLIKKFK